MGKSRHWRRARTPGTDLPYGPELLQRLPGRARVDQDERVALGHGQPLHGRELVRSRRVGDLQRAYVLVAANHLPVRVLDGRYVRLAERALDEPQHQRALAHAARPEHHHPVVVALFRHNGRDVVVAVTDAAPAPAAAVALWQLLRCSRPRYSRALR